MPFHNKAMGCFVFISKLRLSGQLGLCDVSVLNSCVNSKSDFFLQLMRRRDIMSFKIFSWGTFV